MRSTTDASAAAAAASTGQHNTTLLHHNSRVRLLALLYLPSGMLMGLTGTGLSSSLNQMLSSLAIRRQAAQADTSSCSGTEDAV
jgi:hypothetical protein